jgi:hypothetical protein
MEKNITSIVNDIQKLFRDIKRDNEINSEAIKYYQYRSMMLRKLVNKIVNNQKNYPSYVLLNINEQKHIEQSYILLNQIDLLLNNISNNKQPHITNDEIKKPFSHRSFLIILIIFILLLSYYKFFIQGGVQK